MSFSSPRRNTARNAPNTANGTARITANGSVQRSYCAASTSSTITTPTRNTDCDAPPVAFSWNDVPVHSSA